MASAFRSRFEPAAVAPGIEPRHVLYLFDRLRGLEGGAERSLLRLTRLLPPDRYRASIATFWEPEDKTFLRQFSCPVHVFPLRRTYDWAAVKVAMKLRKLICTEKVSIVQTFFATSDLWGSVIAKLSGAPVIISSRRDMGFQRTAKHRLAYRLVTPLFDRVHAVSDAVREFTIQADRVNPRKVVTIPNGVDLKAIGVRRDVMSLRAAYGLKNASHVITDVTTVKYVKGVDVLVRTAAVVCREYPQAMFVVAGLLFEDDYLRALRDLIRSSGLERNFRLLGPCDNVFPLLQMSDVFCHLSRTDGLSNALLEAMACELPCVVSNAGGNPEVVEQGCGGFIVPSEEPETAADRILAFLRNPALGRRMGASARRTVEERFSARGMVRRLVALYDDLLALRGQS